MMADTNYFINQRLLSAAEHGNVNDIKDCIQQGADINCTEEYTVCIIILLNPSNNIYNS